MKSLFGRAVHALSRIGDEIWLEPLQKGSVLPLFRSVATIERSVYRCEISINVLNNRVMFQFNCKHGITKTHNLRYQECEALQAVFPTHLCPNILKSQPKLLSDVVMHFPTSQEEITLSISPIKVKFKSYFEEENDHIRSVCTEMSVHPDEFDYFQVGVDSEATFCLKELRGLLSFAETHGLPVSVHFGAPGRPVSFSVEDMVLEAVVVLSTLVIAASENPSQVSIVQEAPVPRCILCSLEPYQAAWQMALHQNCPAWCAPVTPRMMLEMMASEWKSNSGNIPRGRRRRLNICM
ncbi:cell cycle checkpoint control protein RAD9B isoform X3 [Pygocentrus nattereri]|uniref:cell cycle checkpoint control protein RAD9B isoform X3 n=1 Tax=Pygocentrus nattereri TaxID=42514 RepID=UPI001891E7CC|nr:cell cycle checkpoint control protein RAD9B isoform X3 [Pygocentrus nattereri]